MAHTNQNGDEEIESFKIDPTFEFNAPKCYDFLHQDTEDELRECDEFFQTRPMSPYSQQKMLREFMGMDDGDEFGAFACSVESTPAQTSKDFFKLTTATPFHESLNKGLKQSSLNTVTKTRGTKLSHSLLQSSNTNSSSKIMKNNNGLVRNNNCSLHENRNKVNINKHFQSTETLSKSNISTKETKNSTAFKPRPLTVPRGPTFLERLEISQRLKNQSNQHSTQHNPKNHTTQSENFQVKGKPIMTNPQYKNVPSRYLSTLSNKTNNNINKRPIHCTREQTTEMKENRRTTKITTIRRSSKFAEHLNNKRKIDQISSMKNEQGRNKVQKTIHGTSATISTTTLKKTQSNNSNNTIRTTSTIQQQQQQQQQQRQQQQQQRQQRVIVKRRITVPITPMCLRRSLLKPKEKLLTTEERVMLEAKKQREEFLKMQAQKRKALKLSRTPLIPHSKTNDEINYSNKENTHQTDYNQRLPSETELLRLQEEEERKALKARLRYFSRPPLVKAPTLPTKLPIT